MTENGLPGIRERRLRESRTRLRDTAFDLIAACGYEDVTIAEICAVAQVSRRTFFNYFPSKAAVILGARWRLLTPGFEAEFLAEPAPDILDRLLALHARTILEDDSEISDDPAEIWRDRARRQRLTRSDPALFMHAGTRMAVMDSQAHAVIAKHLSAHPSVRRLDDIILESTLLTGLLRFCVVHGHIGWESEGYPDGGPDLSTHHLTTYRAALDTWFDGRS